jgi:hypothetical protein
MRLRPQFIVSSVLAAVVGWYLYPALSSLGTVYASQAVPAPQVLVDMGLSGQALYQTLHVYDFALWVVCAIPTAIVLALLKPSRLAWYTTLATVPYFVWAIWGSDQLTLIGQYVVIFLAAPAVAVALIAFIRRRLRPNNSFKPRPLRGSA